MSSRHTSTIYRISSKDGSIIWRLGGKSSDFRLQGFNFSSQHDVRVLGETAKTLTLSLFDNKYNTFSPPQGESSGKIIELNLSTKTVRLVQQFNPPRAGFQSGDGGSVQILPNGNVFIGWGRIPYVSEHEAVSRSSLFLPHSKTRLTVPCTGRSSGLRGSFWRHRFVNLLIPCLQRCIRRYPEPCLRPPHNLHLAELLLQRDSVGSFEGFQIMAFECFTLHF